MKIVKPSATLVAATVGLCGEGCFEGGEPTVLFVNASTGPERLIERAGRVCYKSEDKMRWWMWISTMLGS